MATAGIIDLTIKRLQPHPIAAAWVRVAMARSPADRTRLLNGSLEVTLRTLNGFLLPDYLRGPPDPQVEAAIEALHRPSLGHWVGLLRCLAAAITRRDGPPAFFDELDAWYFDPGRKPSSAARLLDRAVALRNEAAHGTPLTGIAPVSRNEDLERLLRELLRSLGWLTAYRPFRILSQRPIRGGDLRLDVQFFCGSDPISERAIARSTRMLLQDTVYVAHPSGARFLDLAPFLSVTLDKRLQQERLFLLKSIPKMKRVRRVNDDTGDADEAGVAAAEEEILPFDTWLTLRGEHDFVWDNADAAADFAAPQVSALKAKGSILDDRFELRELLGEGGMAHVWRAWDRNFEEEVAVKILKPQLADDPLVQDRIRREGKLLHMVRHRHILSGVDLHTAADGRLYLKMPLVTGGHLGALVKPGGMEHDDVLLIAEQALQALEALHGQGVVHRDIKPSNFLLDETGDLLLADLGIARRLDDPRLTRTLEQVGSLAYMAPEQRSGDDVGPAADLYSLALVLHELSTGDLVTGNPGEDLEGFLGELVRGMGALAPVDRPDAGAALTRIQDWRAPEVVGDGEGEDPPDDPDPTPPRQPPIGGGVGATTGAKPPRSKRRKVAWFLAKWGCNSVVLFFALIGFSMVLCLGVTAYFMDAADSGTNLEQATDGHTDPAALVADPAEADTREKSAGGRDSGSVEAAPDPDEGASPTEPPPTNP
jgi:hypothetical protein